MMNEQDNDGEFASVLWDTPDFANRQNQEGNAHIESSRHRQLQASHGVDGDSSQMDRRASGLLPPSTPNGAPGSSASGRYWIKAGLGEAVKMLEGTKDAFVSYSVLGEVCPAPQAFFKRSRLIASPRPTFRSTHHKLSIAGGGFKILCFYTTTSPRIFLPA